MRSKESRTHPDADKKLHTSTISAGKPQGQQPGLALDHKTAGG
jgi:hypothetical protein